MLTRRLIAGLAVRAGVVGREEGSDHELTGLDRLDLSADLFDHAAILVTDWPRLGDVVDAAIIPEVRPAHARRRHSDDGVRRCADPRSGKLLDANISRPVNDCASHVAISLLRTMHALGQNE
jgi:hypothetical protein